VLLFQETHAPVRHPGINPFKGVHNIVVGLKIRGLRVIYAANFLFMFAWVASMQFLPSVLMLEFKFQTIGLTIYLMAIGATWSLTNMFVNRLLAKHFFPGRTFLYCMLLVSIMLLSLIFTRTPIAFLCLFFFAASFASLCWTNGIATISLKAPAAIQGSILGINQSVNSIGAMLSPIIGGALMAMNNKALYAFGGTATLLGFALLLAYKAYDEHYHD
jgi:predicted MFS family arabinose efflux permease